ncbi:DUF2202 domain-containing protein [Sulfurovum sp. bin170]|uniref:DUF2202 domain-containing protein n=1 Tax=Sulfurovum sp. bin170 TaxID=2695268 RepID=UPI0013E0DEF5|nr:DUF2202 domain-containing protein [Sulfurovum sp. bin170]NEW59782.1 DUF2202 domain-containing protein [Sulfurovum sp. bin170]
MRKQITLVTLSLIASAFLIGCGTDTPVADTEVTTSEADTTNITAVEKGYFIDAPVEGLSYKTPSGLAGVTDSSGSFQYRQGEEVNFSIGKLNFGEAEPTAEGLISPRELSDSEEVVLLMLRTLQAMDVDNTPSNGITIPISVISELEKISQEVSISDLSEDSEILALSTNLSEAVDEDYNGVIDVNDTVASAHYETNLENWNNGMRPDAEQGGHGEGMEFNLTQYPESNLTQEVIDSLAYMGNEERLAYDIYMVLYKYHNDNGTSLMQLANIPKSEQKHVEIVQEVIRKYNVNTDNLTDVVDPVADKDVAFADMPMGQYDIPAIQELYNMLYEKGIASPQAAMEVGCMVEVVDIDDLDHFILQAEASNATDIVAAFNILRDGSYKHYWAFDKGLKNMGVADGCAVAGEEWAKTVEEYPDTHGDSGQGGNGAGRQHGRG